MNQRIDQRAGPPAPFPWQQHIVQEIKNALQQKRLSHALLFSGSQGIGKRHAANYLANVLLCLDAIDQQPCGQCKSCTLFASDSHPDFLLLEPEEDGKQIKVEDVRIANEFMHKTAQQSGCKVLLIAPLEAMNLNASNALLKTLEEPGKNSYLILLTHSLSQVLATVRSRCVRYEFMVPAPAQAKDWLLAQGVDEKTADDALALASQQPLLALDLVNNEQLSMRSEVANNIRSLFLKQANFLELAEQWKNYDFLLLTKYLCTCLSDMLKWQIVRDMAPIQEKKLIEFYASLEQRSNVQTLFVLYQKVLEVRSQGLSRANISRQLLIENLLLQWIHSF